MKRVREEEVRSVFAGFGVDVCGIAAIERFAGAPHGFHPKDAYESCASVIVFGKRMPEGSMHVSPRLIYLESMRIILGELDRIAQLGCLALERWGATSVPIPADAPLEYWDEEKKEARGLISLKHAAELAGLGRIGRNTLLINGHFGNRLMLGCVLTDMKLASDDICGETLCPPTCRVGLDSCPQRALDGMTIRQAGCRQIVYGTNAKGFIVCNCNICRVACPRGRVRSQTSGTGCGGVPG
jgi:epoxyqueuosine reductase